MPVSMFNELELQEALKKDGIGSVGIIDSGEGLKVVATDGKLWELLKSVVVLENDRQSRYADYDKMDEDVIPSSALEMVVDDTTQYSQETNSTIWVAKEHKYKKDAEEFFEDIDLEGKVWGWTYNIAKYGDFFLGLESKLPLKSKARKDADAERANDLKPGLFTADFSANPVKGYVGTNYSHNSNSNTVGNTSVPPSEDESAGDPGVTNLHEHKHPGLIYRVDINGVLSGFVVKSKDEAKFKDGQVKKSWEFVHFINNARPNFEEVKIEVNKKDDNGNDLLDRNGNVIKEVLELTSRYGTSILQNARKVYKLLNLLEASLAMSRLSRAPMIRVFYVNTEGMTPDERNQVMHDIEEKFKTKKSLDITGDIYRAKNNPLTNNDELFLPYAGTKGDVRAETLGGEVNIKDIVDIQYLRSKLLAAIRIPGSLLGFDEAFPGAGVTSTPARTDIRYGRMAKKVQRAVIEGVYRLLQIHLSFKYGEDVDISDLSIAMVPVSTAEEDSRLEALERRVGVAGTMLSNAELVATRVDMDELVRYVFTELLPMPGLDVKKFLTKPKEAELPPEESIEVSQAGLKRLLHRMKTLDESKSTPADIIKVLKDYFVASLQEQTKKVVFKDMKAPALSGNNNGTKITEPD